MSKEKDFYKVSDLSTFSDEDFENAANLLLEAGKIQENSQLMKGIKKFSLLKLKDYKSLQDLRDVYAVLSDPNEQALSERGRAKKEESAVKEAPKES